MGKNKTQEQILRASKEIVVKFIEVGRLSPGSFPETFKTIYGAIDATVHSAPSADPDANAIPEDAKEDR